MRRRRRMKWVCMPDHYSWQAWSGVWPQERLALEVERGLLELERIIGRSVTCSAVAGWRADQRVIKAKESFNFLYNSDCRGSRPFLPLLGDKVTGTVQIPVTLPTWDEVVGSSVDAGASIAIFWIVFIRIAVRRSTPFMLKWKELPLPGSLMNC